ncbi:hypothetical protein [Virgibacillus halodenitrificans]|uniref:hypothetical protein n=1 Tax=Virgibacillus halodenitrificans TaxID=1482 RepID=UPI000EF54F33|nr:hypothetical protein [Virgibacillus halodenitrificans]
MSLPKNYLVDTTIDNLGKNFTDLFNDRINEDIREHFTLLFIEEFIEPKTGRQRDVKEVRAYYYKNKFKKTKRNWLASLKRSLTKPAKTPKELTAEIKFIEDGISKNFIDLDKNYEVKSIDELIEKRLNDVETWVSDDDMLLIDYRYIKDKTKRQVQNALNVDFIIKLTDLVIERFNGDLNSIVKEVSDFVTQTPLPGKVGNTRLKPESELNPVLVDEYKNGDLTITTIIDQELAKNKKNVYMNEKDWEIIHFTMSKRDIEFVESQKIFVNIGDIVKNVYPTSRGQKEYQQVIDRLLKLKEISFQIQEGDGDIHVFDLFNHIIFKDDGKRAEIEINEFMHKQYISNQITKIYSDKIKNFNQKYSENMVLILQSERYRYLKQNETKTSHSYPYEFFARRIRFPSRNKTENLKIIDECLKEIVNNEVTVHKYLKKKDIFYITFYPVSQHEAEDLIEGYNAETPILQIQEAIAE